MISGDLTSDVDHLHVKRIYVVNFSYIVIEDFLMSLFVKKI